MKHVQEIHIWPYQDHYEHLTHVVLGYQTLKGEPLVQFDVDVSHFVSIGGKLAAIDNFPAGEPYVSITGSIPHVTGGGIPLHHVPIERLEEPTEAVLSAIGRQIFSEWVAKLFWEVEEDHDQLVLRLLQEKHDFEVRREQRSPQSAYSRRQAHETETREGYGIDVPGFELVMAATRCGTMETSDKSNVLRGYLIFRSLSQPRFFAEIKWNVPENGTFLFYQTYLSLDRPIGSAVHQLVLDSHTMDIEETGLSEATARLLAPRPGYNPWSMPPEERHASDPVKEEKRQLCSWLATMLTKSIQSARQEENIQEAIFVRNLARFIFLDWKMRVQMEDIDSYDA